MLDFSLLKLAVIAIVMLVVVGPKQMPRVARTLGALLGRAQRTINEVKADVMREITLEEFKTLKTEIEQTAQDVKYTFSQTMHGNAARTPSSTATPTPVDASEQPHRTASSTYTNTFGLGPDELPSFRAPSDSGDPQSLQQTASKKRGLVKRAARTQLRPTHSPRAYLQSGAARVAQHKPVRRTMRFF